MKYFHPKRSLAVAALALVSGLAALAPAQAAVYSGKWDPLYGSPFSGGKSGDLAWSATGIFDIPTQCETSLGSFTGTLGGVANPFGAYAGCAFIQLRDVEMTLSTSEIPAQGQDPAVPAKSQTLDIGGVYGTNALGSFGNSDSDCGGEDQRITSVSFVNGQLRGFESSFSCVGLLFDELTGYQPDIVDRLFYLKLAVDVSGFNASTGEGTVIDLANNSSRAAQGPNPSNGNITESDYAPTFVSFDRTDVVPPTNLVPEPGSILLTLTALAFAARLSRRRA